MNYGSTVVENGLIEGMTNIVACVVKNKIFYKSLLTAITFTYQPKNKY